MSEKSADATNDESTAVRARAAARMRRSRDRRAKGMSCFTLELRDDEIASFVRRGLLSPDRRADRAAVVKAMYEFLDRTLGRPM